jgi:hypothetical protein
MKEDEMIQQLQDRFGLSKVKASVIYFKLQRHFTKDGKIVPKNSLESLEVS